MIKLFQVICIFIISAVFSTGASAQADITGHWEGAILIAGIDLGIKTDFKKAGDSLSGKIDIPRQNAFGLNLKEVRMSADRTHFELPAGPGLAVFDGILNGDIIRGDFSQSGVRGTFYLVKKSPDPVTPVEIEKPGYIEEEVVIPSGKDTLGGTLTFPGQGGPFPAVVLITGSGAQNRDEEIFGFKPFRIIADHLTKNGLAVLRCDDRGVGKSTGGSAEITGKDLTSDVIIQMKYLLGRKDIIPGKIGLIGHSEGATIAVMLASGLHDPAFIVLMAGTGASGDSIILRQIEVLSRLSGEKDEEITASLILQSRVYDAVRADSGWNDIRDTILKKTIEKIDALPEEQRKSISDVNAYAAAQVDAALGPARSPWFKFFIDYNPAEDLIKVRCPVLAVFGELDTQVDPVLNSGRMQRALDFGKNKDFSIHIFPKTNHLFQLAETGSPAEYASLAKEFSPDVLDTITKWILERTGIE